MEGPRESIHCSLSNSVHSICSRCISLQYTSWRWRKPIELVARASWVCKQRDFVGMYCCGSLIMTHNSEIFSPLPSSCTLPFPTPWPMSVQSQSSPYSTVLYEAARRSKRFMLWLKLEGIIVTSKGYVLTLVLYSYPDQKTSRTFKYAPQHAHIPPSNSTTSTAPYER